MSGLPNEKDFEKYIERYLVTRPLLRLDGTETGRMEYQSGQDMDFDKDLCLIKREVIAFLKATQPENYRKLVEKRGNTTNANYSIFSTLDKLLNDGGALAVLNDKEITVEDINFRMVYFRPANDKTPEHEAWYLANRLVVKRQLHYSKKERDGTGKDNSRNAIDMAVFVNGIPVFTIELKNELTNQDQDDAIEQYRIDRKVDGEKLLEFKRCLAHFAVSTEQVFVTSRLANENTHFLPFNKTYNNEGVESNTYRTSYLWEDVLRRDSVLDLIENFIHVVHEKEKYYDTTTRRVETREVEKLLFPRWHQRRAVHRLVNDVREVGCGHNYLIEHSAGSGKSNTIAWLAYCLSGFYQHSTDNRPLFDSIIVVNDRRALDSQTQRNFHEFERTEGEVAYVDKNKTSQDLREYIEAGKKIIITTLQKFSVICDSIKHYPDRKFAVVIDEAHSSQTGEGARDMRQSLSLEEAERFDAELTRKDDFDRINEIVLQQAIATGEHRNVSFFAFTATPKPETIKIFAERHNGKKQAFDTYTMEQAIKEGFILNVLECYMSFKRYYKLAKLTTITDKEYEKKKAVRVLNNWIDLQPQAIIQKSHIMLEHFASQTASQIEGQAKAMLVTRSRLHAVRYKLAFDEIMRDMQLPYSCLVAFSGTVHDGETDEDYTETSMNSLPHNASIPDAFKMPQFRILIVANKYQTGFDEPMLHTMFVDKPLADANAVQTLSRLNRTMPGKDSTMILDFVNNPHTIQHAFQDYYGANYLVEDEEADPSELKKTFAAINGYSFITDNDLNNSAKYLNDGEEGKALYNGVIDKIVDKVKMKLKGDELGKFRNLCDKYIRLYRVLSMVETLDDGTEYLKMFFLLFGLTKKLAPKGKSLPYDILTQTCLVNYKAQYQYTKSLELKSEDKAFKESSHDIVSEPPGENYEYLSSIIEALNKKYALKLSDDDRSIVERIGESFESDSTLMGYFISTNTRADIKSKFDTAVDNAILNLLIRDKKAELYTKLTDSRVNTSLKQHFFNALYDRRVRQLKL